MFFEYLLTNVRRESNDELIFDFDRFLKKHRLFAIVFDNVLCDDSRDFRLKFIVCLARSIDIV